MLNNLRFLNKFAWLRGIVALCLAALFLFVSGETTILHCEHTTHSAMNCVHSQYLFHWELTVHKVDQITEVKKMLNCRGEPCRIEIDLIGDQGHLTMKQASDRLVEDLQVFLGSLQSEPFVRELGPGLAASRLGLVLGSFVGLYGLWELFKPVIRLIRRRIVEQ